MKKIKIAAGVAALGIAALPIAGVFADTTSTQNTETVIVTVGDACKITATDATTSDSINYTSSVTLGDLQPGQVIYGGGSGDGATATQALTIVCNGGTTTSWKLEAVGVTNGTVGNNNMVEYVDGTGYVTSSPATIATGTALTGATSNWAFNISKATSPVNDNTNITSGYAYQGDEIGAGKNWNMIPATLTQIATGTGAETITPHYAVYASADQKAATYHGEVKYVLSSPIE